MARTHPPDPPEFCGEAERLIRSSEQSLPMLAADLSCAAIGVHKRTAAIAWADENGRYRREVRTFATATAELERLRDWLADPDHPARRRARPGA